MFDPEQNREFLDYYLDVRFDLSSILFITPANQCLNEHGLKGRELKINGAALKAIIDGYAREAGVRGLENQLRKIMRQTTLQIARGHKKKVTVTKKNIKTYLGNPKFNPDDFYRSPPAGVVCGLAWTALGGTTLFIEAAAIRDKNSGLKQTGQLGKVMAESTEIAYSYIRAKLAQDREYKDFFTDHLIHIHVPAGATPKDGPSAGITIALAIYSLVTQRAVATDIAMTGELTLTGKILPVGGVKEKTIAAKRLKIKTIIIPEANRKDYEELADYIRQGIEVRYVDYFTDLLKFIHKS